MLLWSLTIMIRPRNDSTLLYLVSIEYQLIPSAPDLSSVSLTHNINLVTWVKHSQKFQAALSKHPTTARLWPLSNVSLPLVFCKYFVVHVGSSMLAFPPTLPLSPRE